MFNHQEQIENELLHYILNAEDYEEIQDINEELFLTKENKSIATKVFSLFRKYGFLNEEMIVENFRNPNHLYKVETLHNAIVVAKKETLINFLKNNKLKDKVLANIKNIDLENQNIFDVQEDLHKLVSEIEKSKQLPIKDMQQVNTKVWEELLSPKETLKTSFNQIDKLLKLEKSNLYVIGGTTGTGKTAFSLQYSFELARQNNLKLVYYSLEMLAEEIQFRNLSRESNINLNFLKYEKNKQKTQLDKLAKTFDKISETNLIIDDYENLSINDLKTKTRDYVLKKKCDVVVIDQLAQVQGNKKYETKEQQLDDITWQLRMLAKELNIIVIVINQLDRGGYIGVPTLGNTKGSMAITHHASAVAMLYKIANDEIENRIFFKIDKNRHGETGEIELLSNFAIQRLNEREEE